MEFEESKMPKCCNCVRGVHPWSPVLKIPVIENRIAIVECEFMQPGYRPGEGYFEDIAEFIVLATKILYSRVSWN